MAREKNGIPARDLQRKVEVTYVTAWKMTRKIRDVLPPWQEIQRMRSLDKLLIRCINAPAPKNSEKSPERLAVLKPVEEI